MRIILFPKLIINEEAKECTLKNCSVVIDGQNFFHYLYEKSRIPFVFGTVANEYAKYLRMTFKMFRQANVKCYIVLKAGDTDIVNKIKKFKHYIFDFDTNCDFIPPIYIKDATVQTIQEMGIDHAFCVTESKDECVALALKLGCPLISFDIEYCFRKAPYIPHISMSFKKATNTIQCRQFRLQDFLQKHSLTEEKIAIFATLSDSNIFPQEFFYSLLQTWGVSNINPYIQHKNLIAWLSTHSEQEVRAEISNAISDEDDQNKFWQNYDGILVKMGHVEAGHVTDYLINSKLTIVRQDPDWFEKGVVCKYIAHSYVNLYKWRVIDGSWAVSQSSMEDKTSEDSVFLSIDIIKYAYNLLTNYRKDTIRLYKDAENYIVIDTDDPNIRKPSYNCIVSVFENGWDQVKRLKLFEHFLNENKIKTVSLAKLPKDAYVLFIALVYFARKKQQEGEDVTKEVYAVVLSYVMLNYVYDREGSYKKINYNITEEDCLQADRATKDYFHYDEIEAKRIFDGATLTRLAQLQYCIQFMTYLHSLCGLPYKTVCYSRMYNGTFIFKIYCGMQDKDSDDFVNQLFKSAPSVLELVKNLFQVYRELMAT